MSLYIITEFACLIKCEKGFLYLSANYTNNSFYFCTAVHTLLNPIRDCLVNKIHAFNIFKLFTLFSNKKRSKSFSNLTPLTFTILWKYLFDLFYYFERYYRLRCQNSKGKGFCDVEIDLCGRVRLIADGEVLSYYQFIVALFCRYEHTCLVLR